MANDKTPLRLKSATAASAVPAAPARRDWRILVADDDAEVHAVTRMILGKLRYKERGIELLMAYSAAEATALLERERNIAVILLDVVMETDDAGLRLVRTIREKLGDYAMRIVLRTGQPGQAPEERVIGDYDINDYKAKSELTAQKLNTTVIAALRAYETIVSLDKMWRGLEKILDSTSTLFQIHSMQQFASGVLTQLSAFLGCQPNGVICVQPAPDAWCASGTPCADLQIIAADGEFGDCMSCTLHGDCRHAEMLALLRKALSERRNQLSDDYTVLYLDTGSASGTAALLHGGLGAADEADRKLIEVFSAKISIAFANADHYQKMVSAEEAATTDFLTGLVNRRQLLRLGVPLVAGAHRAGTPLAVAMLDIDHFKRINDTWGHDAGDKVLRRVAALLRERFRTSDVVARFGGEEFCIIATNLDRDAARKLFDAFRSLLEEQVFEIQGQRVPVTVSIGVTSIVADNVDAMISAADAQLFRAKQGGRNRTEID